MGGSRPSDAKRGRRLGLRRHIPRIRSPASAIRARIVCDRERGRVDVGDLVPAQRRRDAGVGRGADRVGAGDRPVAGVLAEVDEDADRGRRRARSSSRPRWSPIRRSTSSASAFANRRTSGKRELGLDRREDVEAGRARRSSGTTASPSSSSTSRTTSAISRTNGHCPSRRRVEVDQQVVGQLDLGHARVPGVQLDAAEVRDPGERGRVVDDREDGRVPARERDGHLVDVVGMLRPARASGGRTRPRRRSGSASCGRAAAGGAAARSRRRRGSTRRDRPWSARLPGRTACPGS